MSDIHTELTEMLRLSLPSNFRCDYLATALLPLIKRAQIEERNEVLAVRRALIDDDRCACENCIREELGEVIDE